MSFANFTKIELKNLFKKPATEKYPNGPATYKEVTRGHVVNDMDACVLCGLCQMRCPTGAITVDKKKQTWSIRPFSCIQCRCCVENCPKKSLSMAKEYTEPDTAKGQHDFDLSDRQKEVLAEQARQAAERAAQAMEARKKAAAAAQSAAAGSTDAGTAAAVQKSAAEPGKVKDQPSEKAPGGAGTAVDNEASPGNKDSE